MARFTPAAGILLFITSGALFAADMRHDLPHGSIFNNNDNEESRKINADLIRNPGLLKEMMRRTEIRHQIMQDKELMKKILKNEELRKEMMNYPEMHDQIMRDPQLNSMKGDNPVDTAH